MSGTTIFVRTPTLKLTVGQRNELKSFMKKTKDKKEYRRAQAVLEKAEGKSYKYPIRVTSTALLSLSVIVSLFASNLIPTLG